MARFACEHADKACVAIIGDLHLKRSDEHLFSEARKQLTASLR